MSSRSSSWKQGDKFEKSGLSSHHGVPQDRTRVSKLGSKPLSTTESLLGSTSETAVLRGGGVANTIKYNRVEFCSKYPCKVQWYSKKINTEVRKFQKKWDPRVEV